MSDVTLEGLRVCREIARLGSFTAAARSLGYSQPAVSRQVSAVEAAVGHRLFVREVRGVSITPAGSLLVAHAARIIGGVATLHHDLGSLGDRLAGRVAIGAFPAAMSVLVPQAIARLAVDHPGLVVALTEASTPSVLRDLGDRRLDVAVIGVGAGLPTYDLAGLVSRQVYAGDLCVAVAQDHRLAGWATVPVRELTDEGWVAGIGSAGDPQFAAWPTLTDPVVRFRVRGWPARLGLVAAGLGVCLLPELASRSVPSGVTTIRVDDPNWLGRHTLAVTRPDPSDAALAVVTALRSAGDDVAP